MAEQVDAADLKSVGRKAVPVRFRPSAPFKKVLFMRAFLIGMIYQSIEAARCRFEPQFAGERSAPVKFLSEQGRRRQKHPLLRPHPRSLQKQRHGFSQQTSKRNWVSSVGYILKPTDYNL